MPSFDPATGSLVLPLWASAIVLALLVVMTIFAIARSGVARTAALLIGIVFCAYAGWVGWSIVDRMVASEREAERQALERRALALQSSAQAPGTMLGCLEGMAGEQVEVACERAVFATPDTVAAAVTHVTAQMALLADAMATAPVNDPRYDAIIASVRRGLETDRYGIVAHVMLQHDNCSLEHCQPLDLLPDANRVRSNLQEKPFNALVAKYAPAWANARLGPPMADLSRVLPPPPPGAPSGVPVSSKYEFPSSSSIPPVNIMGSESVPPPAAANAAPPPAAGAPASTAPAPVPPRRPAAARPPPRTPRAAAGTPPGQQAQPVPSPPGFQQ
jgi:hypothetical protein